jgi:CARDB
MLRAPITIALSAAVLAALSAPAAAAPGAAAPQASVRLVSCSVDTHEAAFKGRMTRIAGAERMAMRFTLLERTGSAGYRPVNAPGLGRWRRSRPGVGTFGYRQALKGLPQNAIHRMRVDFRWYAGDGEVLSRVRRTSRACRQFLALPNLGVSIVGSGPTQVKGVRRYRVRVVNDGRAEVSGASVRFWVNGSALDTVIVSPLAIGQERMIGFRGPACAGSVKATADPDGVIVESSELDNTQELRCAEIPAL